MFPSNPDFMKKLLIFFVFIPLLMASCKKDPVEQPEEIRSYVSIVSLLKVPSTITWVVDGTEVPNEQAYGSRILGAVLLETDSEEISFTAKYTSSGSQIESLLLTMDKDKHYLIVLYGSDEEPALNFQEIETTLPQGDRLKFQFLHAVPSADSIDVYMGSTEAEDRVVSDLSFSEYSGYFEVFDYKARQSVTLSVHGDVYDPEKEILSYEYNDLIVANTIYFSVMAYAIGDPIDTELKLWLYDLPSQ